MHLKRWLTAIVLIPFFIVLIYRGSALLFDLVVCLFALGSMWEYYNIAFAGDKKLVFSAISIWGGLIGILIMAAAYVNSFPLIVCLLLLNMVGAALLSMPGYKNGPQILEVVLKQMQAVVYIPLFLSSLVLLRNGTNGAVWILFFLFVVLAGDSGAFYVGRFFGRHKLCPAISPGKTVEGAVGNLVVSILVGYLFMILFLPALNKAVALIFFIIANLFGQAGDLFASQLKRAGNIKDSGTIFPGHGGFLDRIDAIIFAAPVAFFFKTYIFPVL